MSPIRRYWWQRWAVVIDDLPPMPTRREVAWRTLTRRAAEREARMQRIVLNRSIARGLTAVSVVRTEARR